MTLFSRIIEAIKGKQASSIESSTGSSIRSKIANLIDEGTKIIYSEDLPFDQLTRKLSRAVPNAKPEEIHVAIIAIFEIAARFEDAVYSKDNLSDEQIVSKILDELLIDFDELTDDNAEIRRLKKEIMQSKADLLHSNLQVAFELADLVPADCFGGMVHKANRSNKGPISVDLRKQFKVLAEKLEGKTMLG